MTFDWTKYCDLSDLLHAQAGTFADSEACFRVAISRAYYSAFCASRNHARDNEQLVLGNNAGDHSVVKEHFLNAPDREHQKVAADLGRLRTSRNKADYNDSVLNVSNLSKVALAQAHGILNKLSKF